MDKRDKKRLCCGWMSAASRNPGSLVTSVSISGIQQQLGGCLGGYPQVKSGSVLELISFVPCLAPTSQINRQHASRGHVCSTRVLLTCRVVCGGETISFIPSL